MTLNVSREFRVRLMLVESVQAKRNQDGIGAVKIRVLGGSILLRFERQVRSPSTQTSVVMSSSCEHLQRTTG